MEEIEIEESLPLIPTSIKKVKLYTASDMRMAFVECVSAILRYDHEKRPLMQSLREWAEAEALRRYPG